MAAPATLYDVLIVGGGPAGLSVALGLARQLYSAVVFDSGIYRNASAQHMHNVVTWDHHKPFEFRAAAKANILSRYSSIRFEGVAIDSIKKTDDGLFEAVDQTQKMWKGRKVVLATGVKDIFPEIEGYADCWGTSIFHCLFCHGFEERGQPSAGVLAVGMLSNPNMALHSARMAKRLAQNITVYSNGAEEVSKQLETTLASTGINLETRKIASFVQGQGEQKSGLTVTFANGESKAEAFMAHVPKTQVNGPFVQQLSLDLTEQGDIKTSQPFYETSVPGVFAVGDLATPLKAVAQAMATGAVAAGGLSAQLSAFPVGLVQE